MVAVDHELTEAKDGKTWFEKPDDQAGGLAVVVLGTVRGRGPNIRGWPRWWSGRMVRRHGWRVAYCQSGAWAGPNTRFQRTGRAAGYARSGVTGPPLNLAVRRHGNSVGKHVIRPFLRSLRLDARHP